MGRLLVVVAAALAWTSGAAAGVPTGTPYERVVGVPGPSLDVRTLAARAAAVGLVVPDAGPRTSEARARASLERGEVVNSLRGTSASSPKLIDVGDRLPAGRLPEPLLVVGLPEGGVQRNNRRYPVALLAARAERPALLTSESTRIPGLVAIADVARGRVSAEPHDDPAGYVVELDRRIRANGRTRWWTGLLAFLVTGALALVVPPAALLAPACLLTANLILGATGLADPAVAVPILGAALLAALPLTVLAGRLDERRRTVLLGAVLAGVVALYAVSFLVEQTWVALSPLGPGQNARFYGLSNLLETILLVPALGGAALLARRFGWLALAAVGVLTLVTVAGSRFGADAGGAVVVAAGFAVLAAAYAGGGRRALLLAAAVAAAAVAVAVLDALAGPTTHLGETLRGGPGELARDLVERVELSYRRATDSWSVGAVVFGCVAALAALVARGPRRDLPLAVAVSVAASLVVNDSPKEVAAGGLVAYLTVARLPPRTAVARDAAARIDGDPEEGTSR